MFLIINRKKKIMTYYNVSTLMYNTDILKNICEEQYTLFKSSNKISNQLELLIRDSEK